MRCLCLILHNPGVTTSKTSSVTGDTHAANLTGIASPLKLSPTSGATGSTFTVSITGLIPVQPVLYGWLDPSGVKIFERQINSDFDGSFSFDETVLSSTAPGTYTLYFDQRSWGGQYFTAKFTVLGGIAA